MGLRSLVKKAVKSLTGGSKSASTEKHSKRDSSDTGPSQTRVHRTFGASDHALKRWNERFPIDNKVSVVNACEDAVPGRIPTKDESRKEYYYYPPLGAILVVEDRTIITTYSKGNEMFKPHNHVVQCTGCNQVYEPTDQSGACPWCGHDGRTTGNVAFETGS